MHQSKMTDAEIETHKKKILSMSHLEMLLLRRSAGVNHIYFTWDSPLYLFFENRFQALGGFNKYILEELELWMKDNKNESSRF